ncbi:hypothetical protein IMG5_091730 [Ichthyophthirius multifiliis]|uniref:Uncharacterized protein n=1 Tax=Ichthyophthirius multifiliis TaxID=5932 RepID=G0QRC7_ICHMU|nr:hypothetical protein IMG5_091730 [Ichthyophthirius multifiliis]EGR32225.1 hypothetical protein IMG5_091730 [Ichthyophthirius multifiliis]|eukprot:XP_004035711.1 hypothetical protein IMG5_091730 [Ichthyophthirius multifiliis]
MKNPTPINPKLKSKKMFLAELEKQAGLMQLQRPIISDAYLKKKVQGVSFTNNIQNIVSLPQNSREKTAAVFLFLDKLRALKDLGPGTYDQYIFKPAPTAVLYRKSSYSPIKKHPKEDIPGPDYYYCKDDLLYQNKPEYTFAKADINPQIEIPDWRDYKPQYNQIQKNAYAAIILDEHKPQYIGEEGTLEEERGPGKYEINYKQTEIRTDLGNVKYAELNQNNIRENNMEYLKKEHFDNDLLFPKVDLIKPNNKKTFKYYEETNILPPNPPDSLLFQEEDKFYDVDLNKVRENMKKAHNFAQNMKKDEFAEHEEFMKIMHEFYEKEKKRMPHLGEYDVIYTQIDPHIPTLDIQKVTAADHEPIQKPEGDVDGDNLILNSNGRLQKKVADINMKKMIGRYDNQNEITDYDDDLLNLNPNIDFIKPKIKILVNMKLMMDRIPEEDEAFREEEKLDLNVNYQQIDKKVKGYVDLKKIQIREDTPQYQPVQKEQEIQINVKTNLVKPKKGTAVNMSKGQKRFK